MKKAPLVSIIVPIYNVRDYLDVCVKSLLNQTYKNLEIILIDDGSTDGSEKIVDKYDKKYRNIKAIHKKNGGLSSARNVGVDNASGEWLLFIDSDDYIRTDCVERVLELAKAADIDIVTYSFEPFSNDGSRLKKSPNWPEGVLSGVDAVNDMLRNKRPAYICMSMFRATLFKKNKIRFPEGREFEDIITRIRLLYYARKVVFSNEKLYYYLIRKESITGDNISESRCQDFLRAVDEVKAFLLDTDKQNGFVFLDYFEFHSLVTLLNYLARDRKTFGNSKGYWCQIRGKLRKKYFTTKFPTIKNKFVYGGALIVSSNMKLYSKLYRGVKGEGR
ncbi:glycosyltransferase [Candidatus Saccharibacteria bacterium]|nr:glycosyltransferase [Candidatus Saccharibacteria bacterium]